MNASLVAGREAVLTATHIADSHLVQAGRRNGGDETATTASN
jgi:hypothetical protein